MFATRALEPSCAGEAAGDKDQVAVLALADDEAADAQFLTAPQNEAVEQQQRENRQYHQGDDEHRLMDIKYCKWRGHILRVY